MGIDFYNIEHKTSVEICARHIPEHEYQNLDKLMDAEEMEYGVLSSFYSRGVVLMIMEYDSDSRETQKLITDFPMLAKIVEQAYINDIYYMDLDERGNKLDDIVLFKWQEGEDGEEFNSDVHLKIDYNTLNEDEIDEDDLKEIPKILPTENPMDWIIQMKAYIEERKRRESEGNRFA